MKRREILKEFKIENLKLENENFSGNVKSEIRTEKITNRYKVLQSKLEFVVIHVKE